MNKILLCFGSDAFYVQRPRAVSMKLTDQALTHFTGTKTTQVGKSNYGDWHQVILHFTESKVSIHLLSSHQEIIDYEHYSQRLQLSVLLESGSGSTAFQAANYLSLEQVEVQQSNPREKSTWVT